MADRDDVMVLAAEDAPPPAGLAVDDEDNPQQIEHLLRAATAHAEAWLQQREAIVARLQDIRATADRLLAQIGGAVEVNSARDAVGQHSSLRR